MYLAAIDVVWNVTNAEIVGAEEVLTTCTSFNATISGSSDYHLDIDGQHGEVKFDTADTTYFTLSIADSENPSAVLRQNVSVEAGMCSRSCPVLLLLILCS
jgi:hypothetical protein